MSAVQLSATRKRKTLKEFPFIKTTCFQFIFSLCFFDFDKVAKKKWKKLLTRRATKQKRNLADLPTVCLIQYIFCFYCFFQQIFWYSNIVTSTNRHFFHLIFAIFYDFVCCCCVHPVLVSLEQPKKQQKPISQLFAFINRVFI